jgi:tetrachlorobenzoquinone reductase
MELLVVKLEAAAHQVVALELRHPYGQKLPPFTAGSHIDVTLPNGLTRQYSLCNDPRDRDHYRLGVGLAANSRGGSQHIHQSLKIGDKVKVSEPRSLFGLNEGASRHIFIAGGIGVTPILSMIQWCEGNDRPWRLLYCVRSRDRAAFLDELRSYGDRVTLHCDDESDGDVADLQQYLGHGVSNADVYCCGPTPLMDAVALAAARSGIAKSATHFERFAAPEISAEASCDRQFAVVLCRSGKRVDIPPGTSILETLEQQGLDLPFSCREGLCRTCEVPVLGGIPDHRDYVLSDDERSRNKSVLVCVSRALSDEMMLDI